jgi:hypothetical protein
MAISGGIDWVTAQKALQNWVVYCTGLAADHVVWGQQQAPRPAQPGVIMRIMLLDDNNRPWVDVEPNPLVIPTITVTGVDATANTFTKTGHGLLTGDGPVQLSSTVSLPGNITALTNYWIIKVDADKFKLATKFLDAMNNVAVDLADAGSGVITLDDTATTVRQGQEVKFLARSLQKALLTLECYTDVGVGMDMATAILWRVGSKRMLPTASAILEEANVSVIDVDRVRAVGGTQSQYLFEPRAMLDVKLYLVSEEAENTTIIERTEITNEDTLDTFTVDAAE